MKTLLLKETFCYVCTDNLGNDYDKMCGKTEKI